LKKLALISVYDKAGIIDFAKYLIDNNYDIISTSGTAKLLRQNNIPITTIEELTNSPEILDGRVKTLHPFVFGGILANRSIDNHLQQLKNHKIPEIDLVVVNLYPFSDTIKKEGCTIEEAIEQIDIGGVSLIRAAAKNFSSVSVIVDPLQYSIFIESLINNKNINQILAAEAFEYISSYDLNISNYFRKISGQKSGIFDIYYNDYQELRYGENPHQKSTLFNIGDGGFNWIFEKLHGKELSYINILDIDAAYNLINEFLEPSCAILKHTNPCGAASSSDIKDAYLKALACDNVSAFGGINIFNRKLDLQTCEELDKIFTEVVIAPEFDDDAIEFLLKKKNRRIIRYKKPVALETHNLKSVNGGLLLQENDNIIVNENELKIVTERKPTVDEMNDMLFAMKVCKHTKSNSVIYAKNFQTIGIGGGQPSRVDSSMLAVVKAKRFGFDIKGSSVASDAFFPFADGIIEAAKAGAAAVIQPGGSVRDNEVIEAANQNNIAMIFSGIRHFRH
jgi:phosphoribosylaminoimidazolecarboxamide formyltransferase / IMP cyclohydrolase